MKRKAVFIDRDGTIIKEVDHLTDINRLEIFQEAPKAICVLNYLGYLVIIITNQSVIGRGMLTISELDNIHNRLILLFKKEGANIDDILYCSHRPEDNCECRKPKAGLIEEATKKYNIDLKNSYMIGDNISDMELSKNVGCQGILVETGYGKIIKNKIKLDKKFIVKNIFEAANLIKNK